MSRFLKFLVVISMLVWSCQEVTKPTKPNILFIMTDDHASHAISAYGGIYDEIAPTPNIDRLAKEGALLQNVFCTNAICGPSRATILTGKFSHLNGYYKNHLGGKFDSTQWTFPWAFQQNGYQTALFGKWHLGTEPVGFDYYKYHNNQGQQGTYYDPIYNENGVNKVEKGYATTLTANFAINWLEQRSVQTGQPFMMMLQFKAPHRKWQPEEKYMDLFEDITMPIPRTFWDNYEGRELTAGDTDMTMDNFDPRDMKISPPDTITDSLALSRWGEMGYKRGTGVGWLPNDTMTIQEAREWKYQRYIKDYLACVRSVDDQIGRVLDYLDEKGLAENTIVIYTSDQGFYLGDHGWYDKRFMYEPSLRMPFIMRYPGVIPAASVNHDLITNVDFAPTLLDFAGIPSPDEVQGKSFRANLIEGRNSDWREATYYHYYEYPFWHHVQPHYGIRNERYKLIHFYYDIDIWEFYDLKQDPDELNNVYGNPEYADLIDQLKSELQKLQQQYEDDISLDSMRVLTKTNFGIIGGGDH
ncbi:sulfatase [Marinoscillum sp. MHG1-6]|uniref:sulfatase family protein n=1 Tax=Marinoscillum sp. MHG1-6 TaxID=2959627 RepID=UPI0021588AE4|nr:sulfatase [Marinoscillum sp. MHG1-6]